MNIFQDLVDELKEENLLEETVISEEDRQSDQDTPGSDGDQTGSVEVENDAPADSVADLSEEAEALPEPAVLLNETVEVEPPPASIADESMNSVPLPELPEELVAETEESDTAPGVTHPSELDGEMTNHAEDDDEGIQFYKQRAIDEVTGLQLVEHVISGVEREQMKASPKVFDDLAVKRSLHEFLKVADNINSTEHAKCEFQLMQETENWASALSRRDRNISVAHLRRYCETTKPSLSSQALISLARFYRNSPYSESVRGKFDLVFTRLFTKEVEGDERKVIFENKDFVAHIKELYADWSSIPLYSTDEEDPDMLVYALNFQEFINEASSAESFDQLVKRDFFKRLKVFKESTRENFFSPVLVAAAIECNVAVGNRYVQLLELERQKSNNDEISEKYSNAFTGSISEATSKTLEIVELLNAEKPEVVEEEEAPVVEEPKKEEKAYKQGQLKESQAAVLTLTGGANRWLIVATVVVALVVGWYFLQSGIGGGSGNTPASGKATEFNLKGTPVDQYVLSGRISKMTLFGITRDSWKALSKDEKRKVLKDTLKLGKDEAYFKVHFLDKDGKTVGFASKARVQVN